MQRAHLFRFMLDIEARLDNLRQCGYLEIISKLWSVLKWLSYFKLLQLF